MNGVPEIFLVIINRDSVAARVAYAFRHYKRFQRLFEEEAVTREEFDRAKASYRTPELQKKVL